MAKGRLGATSRNGRAGKDIKNKIKRQAVYHKLKKEGGAALRKARAMRQKEAEKLGDAAPKPVQRTLDNTREVDETFVQPGDEEIAAEDSFDEFSGHFGGEIPNKTLVTTGRYPSEKLMAFLQEVVAMLPNCEYRQRGAVPLKQIVDACNERGFTCLLVFTEKSKKPQSLWMVKLPYGPTARFKVRASRCPAGRPGMPTRAYAARPKMSLVRGLRVQLLN
jgi:ribosome production factor 1